MISDLDTGRVLAHRPVTARSFGMRLRGLIGRSFSPGMDGMVFPRCGDIHTCFMGMAIDVMFLNRDRVVCGLVRGAGPWRWHLGCKGAVTVVELPSGTLEECGVAVGHRIDLDAK